MSQAKNLTLLDMLSISVNDGVVLLKKDFGMSYFPAFIKLDQQKILIVGGGKIAYEKLEHLLDFTQNIEIIAKSYSKEMLALIDENQLTCKERMYQKGDVSGFAIVIVAVDDIPLQADIFLESKQYNCLCNSVDSTAYCDFIFPAYIKKDDLTIAISTSGASPALAKHLRNYLRALIPSTISDFLKEVKELRTTLPKGKERMLMLDKKEQDYINTWRKS